MSDELEAATVRCISAGWERDEDGKPQFRAVVVFDAPPNWPFNVAWGGVPIRMQPLPIPAKEGSPP